MWKILEESKAILRFSAEVNDQVMWSEFGDEMTGSGSVIWC